MKVRDQHCNGCGAKWRGVHLRCYACGKKLTKEEQGEDAVVEKPIDIINRKTRK